MWNPVLEIDGDMLCDRTVFQLMLLLEWYCDYYWHHHYYYCKDRKKCFNTCFRGDENNIIIIIQLY